MMMMLVKKKKWEKRSSFEGSIKGGACGVRAPSGQEIQTSVYKV